MRAAAALLGAALFVATAGLAAAADEGTVFVWVDKDGTPHYQDRPPEGSTPESAREMSLRYKMTDPEAVAAAAKRQSELTDAAKVREQQQAGDADADKADKAKVRQEAEQCCKLARERLEKYDTAHRLYKPAADGTRTYLTDEETDQARADARRDVEQFCGG
jgi:Spy/CpxP family protein refolding chaperone